MRGANAPNLPGPATRGPFFWPAPAIGYNARCNPAHRRHAVDTTRYAKTGKGIAEIQSRGQNLRGRLRTMLILTDPSKTGEELRASAAQLGVDSDFLETLARDGYIAAVAGSDAAPAAPSPSSTVVTTDELNRFRAAKSFINETIVDALGIRAFLFTLKLERCATREDLARLLPDYAKAIRKFRGESETRLIVERAKELLA